MKSLLQPALGLLLMSGAASLHAAPISCSVDDATANGEIADQCRGDDSVGANPASETSYITSVFGSGFDYIGKFEKDEQSYDGEGAPGGYSVTVTLGDGEYLFNYTVTVPVAQIGSVVDFVLGIKQANNSFLSYLFEGVTLGIDGSYNNFWINPAGKTVNDYSHASAWIRASDDPVPVPAPGSLTLLGAGLLGLVLARRRRS